MSSSLLYHAFGVRGYQYVATRYEGGETVFRIESSRKSLKCPACGDSHVHVIARFRRRWKTVPVGCRPTWIEMEVPRVECQKCHARRRVPVAFAEPKRQHTKRFERYVCELLQWMTPHDVAWHLGISWDTGQRHPETPAEQTLSPHPAEETAADRHR